MERIITILKRFIPKQLPKPLGRWKIEDCNKKLTIK